MAERTRAFDWSRTPVGSIEKWPEILLNTVNTLLACPQPVLLLWGKELVQFYNDAFRPSLGVEKHPGSLGQPGRDCWAEAWATIGPQIEAVMADGKSSWHEDTLVPNIRDGVLEDVYWTYSYSPVRDIAGNILGTLVVCMETTHRILAENAVRTERAKLLELFQQAPAFFALLHGPDHIITMANPLFLRRVGDRDVVGKPVRIAMPEAVEQGYVEIMDRVYRTGEPHVALGARYEISAGDSLPRDERYLDFTYQPLRGADGSISDIIVLGVDITDRKRAQDALIQSEKLAAVGRLTSSIAHEINNPLEAIANILYLLRDMDHRGEVRKYLDLAEQELFRVSAITSQTLRFPKQPPQSSEVRCEDLIDSVLSLYHGRITNLSIAIERRERARRSIRCFEGEIRQVLSNLVGNSIDAMQEAGGRLMLRCREAHDTRSGQRGIVITVADTGSGMSTGTREKAFQPFFTTKGISGTGLGLWISKEIVDRHHGRLRVKSSQHPDHRGTVIAMFLPFEAAPHSATPALLYQ